ncbi:hypothetical protein [Mycobacterium tilburgii]|uniref:hypothetical protein n=1 Tax=Mycobacterium tilburgii TaxID=44467 RepID=UPI0021B4110B|nr:hypothetical protein [Mycobacterium tilburgii]
MAARRLEPIDAGLARETYLDAINAAAFAARLAGSGGGVIVVAQAAAAAPRPAHAPRADLLLDGLAANFVEGYPAAVPDLTAALSVFGDRHVGGRRAALDVAHQPRAALHLWDDERWDPLSSRYLELAHKAGALNDFRSR